MCNCTSEVRRFASPRNDELVHPQKIAFADLDAVVAQDAVGSGGMEVEIRQREMVQELLALESHGVAPADGEGNVASLRALERFRLERFHIVDGPGEACLEFIEGLFSVGGRRHLALGEPRAALSRKIADKLDLFGERQHVRIEPGAEQHVGLDILRLAVCFGLGEEAGEAAENLQEGRNGGVVEGHGMLFRLMKKVCCWNSSSSTGRVCAPSIVRL